jgi:hypothetical protein
MSGAKRDIDRLLQSAAQAPEEASAEPPFGFETRVVALWRSGKAKANGLGALFRGIVVSSAVIMIVSAAATFREYQQGMEAGDVSTNEFAIADSAIQAEFSK